MRIIKKFMLTTVSILVLLVVAFVILFIVYGHMSRAGSPPGLVNNQLTPCPPKKNCVCSEYREDSSHFIEPLPLTSGLTLEQIKNTIEQMGGIVENQQDNYLATTFSSDLFGFVDDLEVRIDEQAAIIHLRSGSRVGTGDLGVNRKRVETLIEKLK